MRALLVAVLMLAGCAGPTQQLSSEDRARLKAVRLGTVQKGQLFILAPGKGIGLMFGAVGGALAAGPIEDSRKAFSDFIDRNGISIEGIARAEVARALAESRKLALETEGEPSAPRLNIAVQQYGFGVPHLASSNVVPVLMIRCEIVDAAGKVLWSAADRMGPSIANPMETTTWQALHDQPSLIDAQWRKAALHLARSVFKEL